MSSSTLWLHSIRQRMNGFYVTLTLITLLGAGLRLIKLGDYPGGFGQDEAVNLYDAWSLLATGAEHHGTRWPLNTGQFGDYPSALQAYLTIPFVALLGPTELAARLPCALLNTLAIPLFGMLLYSLFRSRAAALFAAALLATSPWNIFFSRWAVSPGFVTFFQIAGLLLMIRLLTTRLTGARLYGTAIVTGFTLFMWTHQYLSQYFFAPLVIGIGFLLWNRTNWPRILVASGTYSLFMILAIVHRVGDPSTAGRFSRESVFFSDQPWQNFWQHYSEYLSFDFIFNAPKMLPLHQIPGVAHIQHFLSPFYLLGLGVLIAAALAPRRCLGVLHLPDSADHATHWRLVSIWMLLGLILAPVTGAVFIQDYYTSRMTHLLTHITLITALGCAACWYLLMRIPRRSVAILFVALVSLYLALSTIKTTKGLVRGNLFFKGWLQQGLPDVMRYLGRQPDIKSVQFPLLMQGYIYHLIFSPIHPATLNHAEVALPLPTPDRRWNYANIETVGTYHFFPDMDPERIAATCTLRHEVRDNTGLVWYRLYEKNGDWYVLKNKDLE